MGGCGGEGRWGGGSKERDGEEKGKGGGRRGGGVGWGGGRRGERGGGGGGVLIWSQITAAGVLSSVCISFPGFYDVFAVCSVCVCGGGAVTNRRMAGCCTLVTVVNVSRKVWDIVCLTARSLLQISGLSSHFCSTSDLSQH